MLLNSRLLGEVIAILEDKEAPPAQCVLEVDDPSRIVFYRRREIESMAGLGRASILDIHGMKRDFGGSYVGGPRV